MDANAIFAWGASIFLGISAVSVVVAKISGKAKKYLSVAREALDLLDETLKAVEDGKVETLEVERIREEGQQLADAIKKAKA